MIMENSRHRSDDQKPAERAWGTNGAIAVLVSLILIASALGTTAGAAGPRQIAAGKPRCSWQTGFVTPDLDGTAYAAAVFDDGSGPALYVGGSFVLAGGVEVLHIARWDGRSWSAVGRPGAVGTNRPVLSLATFDDGTGPALYVGGVFSSAGGVPAAYLAKWNGSDWLPVVDSAGLGIDGDIFTFVGSLAVFDDGSGRALYAAGDFNSVGGTVTNNIVRWDGKNWTSLAGPTGVGTSTDVLALEVYDDGTGEALYVGGAFATAGGVEVDHIAKWDGTDWTALAGPNGSGTSSWVSVLAIHDDGAGSRLFVGGLFAEAGGVVANRIAAWDGSGWSALSGPAGVGTNNIVDSLEVFDDGSGPALYLGGQFSATGGVIASRIAKWDGAEFSALEVPAGNGANDLVTMLTAFDDGTGPALYVGGKLSSAGGVTVNHIARWDGTVFERLGGQSGDGMSKGVSALVVHDSGAGPGVVAAGAFTNAGSIHVNHVAERRAAVWNALSGPSGTGLGSSCNPTYPEPAALSLASHDDGAGPALYLGGEFAAAGGEFVGPLARWDGTAWSGLFGPGGHGISISYPDTCPYVFSLASLERVGERALFAGGVFNLADGEIANNIARWSGSEWAPLVGPVQNGIGGAVFALAVLDTLHGYLLFAGGHFQTAGGVSAEGIAVWDGTGWSALVGSSGNGLGPPGDVRVTTLAVFDDGAGPALYVGGVFTIAGKVSANTIARWDGTEWAPLAGPAANGVDGPVAAFTVFDDGSGPALYAGGEFTSAGGVEVNRVAKWDGARWSELAGPLATGIGGVEPERVTSLAGIRNEAGATLYAGGSFYSAGGLHSSHIAAWQCGPVPLFADDFETGDTVAWSVSFPD